MGVTVLITGFGPFPGAAINPTGPLAQRLAKLRRPALADARLIAHVFRTSYAAVDRDLPALVKEHKPDALLMFGLATRTPHIRIETRARNAIALLAGADRAAPKQRAIALNGASSLMLPFPAQRLLAAARTARGPAKLSRDAGSYLCNYLCWRAVEICGAVGPSLAAFIHVPKLRGASRRRGKRRKLAQADLVRTGSALLVALTAAARALPNVNAAKN